MLVVKGLTRELTQSSYQPLEVAPVGDQKFESHAQKYV